jgi:hypothetical protein
MQGLWKENVSGWNHKDTRRKKQTRNNIFRDKGRVLFKVYDAKTKRITEKYDPDIYRRENEQVIVYKPDVTEPLVKITNAYKARIEITSGYKPEIYELQHNIDGEIVTREYTRFVAVKKRITMLVYFDENKTNQSWRSDVYYAYDVQTRKPIWKILKMKNPYSRNYEILYTEKTDIEVKLDWEKVKEYNDKWNISSFYNYNIKEFLYGKFIPNWKRNTLYNDGKRRKIGQDIANGSDRTIIRDWISKGDWDKVIPTHSLTKSIAWFVS